MVFSTFSEEILIQGGGADCDVERSAGREGGSIFQNDLKRLRIRDWAVVGEGRGTASRNMAMGNHPLPFSAAKPWSTSSKRNV